MRHELPWNCHRYLPVPLRCRVCHYTCSMRAQGSVSEHKPVRADSLPRPVALPGGKQTWLMCTKQHGIPSGVAIRRSSALALPQQVSCPLIAAAIPRLPSPVLGQAQKALSGRNDGNRIPPRFRHGTVLRSCRGRRTAAAPGVNGHRLTVPWAAGSFASGVPSLWRAESRP